MKKRAKVRKIEIVLLLLCVSLIWPIKNSFSEGRTFFERLFGGGEKKTESVEKERVVVKSNERATLKIEQREVVDITKEKILRSAPERAASARAESKMLRIVDSGFTQDREVKKGVIACKTLSACLDGTSDYRVTVKGSHVVSNPLSLNRVHLIGEAGGTAQLTIRNMVKLNGGKLENCL